MNRKKNDGLTEMLCYCIYFTYFFGTFFVILTIFAVAKMPVTFKALKESDYHLS